MTDEPEMIRIKRENMWEIFTKNYERIAEAITSFFGGEEEIKNSEIEKDFKTFKEMMVNSVDKIHKEILIENAKQKEKDKKVEEEKTEKTKIKTKKSFWD